MLIQQHSLDALLWRAAICVGFQLALWEFPWTMSPSLSGHHYCFMDFHLFGCSSHKSPYHHCPVKHRVASERNKTAGKFQQCLYCPEARPCCRFSQIPDIGSMWWLSYVATIMSFAYAFIGLGLAIGKTTEKGHPDYGTAWGMAHHQPTVNATWNTFTTLGSMAYAYSFVSQSAPHLWP